MELNKKNINKILPKYKKEFKKSRSFEKIKENSRDDSIFFVLKKEESPLYSNIKIFEQRDPYFPKFIFFNIYKDLKKVKNYLVDIERSHSSENMPSKEKVLWILRKNFLLELKKRSYIKSLDDLMSYDLFYQKIVNLVFTERFSIDLVIQKKIGYNYYQLDSLTWE